MADKVRVNVTKAHKLNLGSRIVREFKEGVQWVEREIAEHWFFKAHSEPVAASAPVAEAEAEPQAEEVEATADEAETSEETTEEEATDATEAEAEPQAEEAKPASRRGGRRKA